MNRNFKLELMPHQSVGSNFFTATSGKCVLGDDMGIGKTATALYWAEKHNKKTLLVVPASLQLNWVDEIEKFTSSGYAIIDSKSKTVKSRKINYFNPGLNYLIISYNYLNRLITRSRKSKKVVKNPRYSYIPNQELMTILSAGFTNAVFDEGHFICNLTSQRTKNSMALCKMVKHTIFLTGTPIKNRPKEFFPMLNIVAPDVFKSYWHYGNTFCQGGKNQFGKTDFKGASNLDLLHQLIKPFFLRRKKEDVLKDLPDKTRQTNFYDLSSLKKYTEMVCKLRDAEDKKHVLAILNEIRQVLAEGMIENTINFIKEIYGSKIIVGTMFLETLKRIKEELGDEVICYHGGLSKEKKNQVIKTFNESKSIKVIAGTISSMGVGLNITSADKVIFNDIAWTPGENFQFEDRTYRKGQKNNVNVYYNGFRKTYHETMFSIIQEKNSIIEKVLEGQVMTDGHVLDAVIKNMIRT